MTDSHNDGGDFRRIDDQAAAWAARRLSGAFNKNDEAQFLAWLDADARHSIALAEYMAIADASALAGAAGGLQTPANDETVRRRTPARKAWLIGAPAVAASLFAAFFFIAPMQDGPTQIERFATVRGETRDISLPDGTTVTLNTDTVLTFSADDDGRYATLERGEVFFDVAREESRPFTVDAGDAHATVLGTSFTIRKKQAESVICVISGVVAVRSTADIPDADGVRLGAGQQIVVASTGDVSGINNFDTDIAATWRHGYLYFDKTPLTRVVADLNRYFDPQIELGDAALGDAPVSGRVELADQDIAVRAISVALSLKVDQRDPDKIILQADE